MKYGKNEANISPWGSSICQMCWMKWPLLLKVDVARQRTGYFTSLELADHRLIYTHDDSESRYRLSHLILITHVVPQFALCQTKNKLRHWSPINNYNFDTNWVSILLSHHQCIIPQEGFLRIHRHQAWWKWLSVQGNLPHPCAPKVRIGLTCLTSSPFAGTTRRRRERWTRCSMWWRAGRGC